MCVCVCVCEAGAGVTHTRLLPPAYMKNQEFVFTVTQHYSFHSYFWLFHICISFLQMVPIIPTLFTYSVNTPYVTSLPSPLAPQSSCPPTPFEFQHPGGWGSTLYGHPACPAGSSIPLHWDAPPPQGGYTREGPTWSLTAPANYCLPLFLLLLSTVN